MRPIKFKESNTLYAKDQPQYLQLPGFVDPNPLEPHGDVVFCMGLSFRERLRLLFTGRLWCSLRMFRTHLGNVRPLTPSFFTTKKSDVLTH